jgi:hypothetical protein
MGLREKNEAFSVSLSKPGQAVAPARIVPKVAPYRATTEKATFTA